MKRIIFISCLIIVILSISSDNACSFHIGSKLFTMISIENPQPYTHQIDDNTTIVWNFCKTFIPEQCPNNTDYAYSFVVSANQNEAQQEYQCVPYTSNSYIYRMQTAYKQIDDDNNRKKLFMQFQTQDKKLVPLSKQNHTIFQIQCSEQYGFETTSVQFDQNQIFITGKSSSGCPLFQISSLWKALQDNSIILGCIIFTLGIYCLFFGRSMLIVTIFIASYFCGFVVLGGIFTVFVGPNSNFITIYFCLILVLFLATLFAYGMTKLMGISIFFIGAWLGFIIGALVNSVFSKIFQIYSVWSLVIFDILFIIPFGLITFKYADYIIILSTSVTGAYMIVRPVSWLLGGFPNQFLLQQLFESRKFTTLPWTFFIYLILIIALAIVGIIYQYLKLKRQNPNQQIQINFVQQVIQEPIDKVKAKLDNLITQYKQSSHEDQYQKMKEMQERAIIRSETDKLEVQKFNSEQAKKRKSKPQQPSQKQI